MRIQLLKKFLKAGILLTVLALSPGIVHGQYVQWAHSAISPGFEYGNGMTSDDQGNYYVTGQIEQTTFFDNGPGIDAHGSHDIFIGKYSSNGNLVWVKSAGGHRGDVGYAIGVDANYNVYSTGEIEDTCFFTFSDSIVGQGSNDMYVSKHSSTGQFLWAKDFGSAGNDKGFAMATAPNGDCFITGYYSGAINFDNVSLSNSGSTGTSEVFVLKLNSNGDVQWAQKGSGQEADRGHGITYDRNGNIYVVGYFTEEATFSGTQVTTGNGVKSAFMAKYDPSGNLTWIKNLCCDSSDFNCVAVDENGNIYTAGKYYFNATVGSTNLTSAGDADILLVKYDPSGNVVWAKTAGGPYEDEAYAISIDTNNDIVYITGQIDDHGYFGPHYAGAAGNRDVFLAAYNYNGDCQWAKPYGGVQRDIGYSMALDVSGNIAISGIFVDAANFGSYHLAGDAQPDLFIFKVAFAPIVPPTNPATNLSAAASGCTDMQLSFNAGNGSGRIVVAHQGSAVNATPVDGNEYNANASFGSGDDLGGNNYVVYKGGGNSVTVTNLTAGNTYYFTVYELNGTGGVTSYLTTNSPTASQSLTTFAVNISSSANAICEGDTVTITASGGSTYQWTAASSIIGSTTNAVVQAHPAATKTYTVTATDNGCQVQNTITINVNPLPAVNFSWGATICQNSSPVFITGATPAGGTFSGPGVTNNYFNPAHTGLGNKQLIYTYTDANGCTDSDPSSCTVVAAPSVNLGNDTTICAANSITLHAGGGQTSYLWSNGNTHANITIDSSGVGLGSKTMFVTVENGNGCMNSDTIKVIFSVCAGIGEPGSNPLIKLYPNPFSTTLTVYLDQQSDVLVYDVSGKNVLARYKVNGNQEFGDELAPGMYTVVVLQKEYRSVYSVIKNTY